jgi:hypothetical protein
MDSNRHDLELVLFVLRKVELENFKEDFEVPYSSNVIGAKVGGGNKEVECCLGWDGGARMVVNGKRG